MVLGQHYSPFIHSIKWKLVDLAGNWDISDGQKGVEAKQSTNIAPRLPDVQTQGCAMVKTDSSMIVFDDAAAMTDQNEDI